MIIKDVIIRAVNRWKGGNVVVSFLIKAEDLPDLATRLVLEDYCDDNTPLVLAITEDGKEEESSPTL